MPGAVARHGDGRPLAGSRPPSRCDQVSGPDLAAEVLAGPKDATLYLVSLNAPLQSSCDRDLPGFMVIVAVFWAKSTLTLSTPSIFERISRTLAAHPEGHVIPST